jgi:hypothetical protein
MTICLVDTSIFCNIVEVPGRCQQRDDVLDGLREKIEQGWNLLLPLAAIVETGNHVAQVSDGNQRRRAAQRFVEQVRQAIRGQAPWVVTPMPDANDWLAWLDEFPDSAMRGVSIGDLTIIKEYERQCELHRARRVLIWSLDGDLQVHDRVP